MTIVDMQDATGFQHSSTDRTLHRTALRMSMLAVCVRAYRIHGPGANGRCGKCGGAWPCRTRQHAVAVIEAHAQNPRHYDGENPR
jgi:hypothetical protein